MKPNAAEQGIICLALYNNSWLLYLIKTPRTLNQYRAENAVMILPGFYRYFPDGQMWHKLRGVK